MKKFLFETQDILFFLIGALSGFGINIWANKISNFGLGAGVGITVISIFIFVGYKSWIGGMDKFAFYLKHSKWHKNIFEGKDTWICNDTDEYQLVEGEELNRSFKEIWTDSFPDNENNYSLYIYLKRNGIIVRKFAFVYCDGGRYLLPMPKPVLTNNNTKSIQGVTYYWDRNSIEYKLGTIIGIFYIHENLQEIANNVGINVI